MVKELVNGYSRQFLLLVIAALLGYTLWTVQDMRADVKQNTKEVVNAVNDLKWFKEQVMDHNTTLYDHSLQIQTNREAIIETCTKLGLRGGYVTTGETDGQGVRQSTND